MDEIFIATELHIVFAAPKERNIGDVNRAYSMSLLRSSSLWFIFRVYKHSIPPELRRFVAAFVSLRRCVKRTSQNLVNGGGAEKAVVRQRKFQIVARQVVS